MAGLGLIRVRVAMSIRGDEMLLDFTGTSPQVRAALNLPTYDRDGHFSSQSLHRTLFPPSP